MCVKKIIKGETFKLKRNFVTKMFPNLGKC